MLPLFNTHDHQMPKDYPKGCLKTLFAENNPLEIVLLGTGNVFEHQEHYPSKAFALSNFKDLDINLGKFDSQLKAGFHGIGEVSIRNFKSGPSANKGQDTTFAFD